MVAESVADIRSELDRLVGPGPATRYGVEQLPDLRRYLQALAWRVTKLPDDPAADQRRLESAQAAEQRMSRAVPGWPVAEKFVAGFRP